MQPFIYNSLPGRVIFGTGTQVQVVQEVQNLGCGKVIVLTTPQQIKQGHAVEELLGDLCVGLYTRAAMHTPTDITDDAMKAVKELGADCIVAVGGGSTIGLGKAIALRTDLPQIVIPTTYAGSEATPILGQTENGLKTGQRTLKVLPEVIIYDVNLTLTLPRTMSVTSGINAIAHAVEALYSKEANPVIDLLAQEGIKSIARSLPTIVREKDATLLLEARSDALYGAWACGTCLGAVGMSLHHKLCHTLGGSFNLPHAETHTVILPHAIVYNAPFASDAISKVASSLGVTNAAQCIYDLSKGLGAPYSLRELGMKEEDLEIAADIALKSPYPNPAPLEREKLLKLLRDAWAGNRPE
ncbi:iron-containing alcohol dehydrogenase [Lyophyllum atratum]|nr:iron-containing alcohol dehydrogenase [Lyophyllum atratum]